KASITIIAVTNTPSVFHFTENLSTKYNNVIPAIGLHPELAMQRKHELSQMWDILPRTKFLGEIGLDYVTTDQNERKVQRDVFSQIIHHCSFFTDKVLTIHSRRSVVDVISILGNSFSGKIILHWFSGTQRQAEKGIENGYYFSINSSMLKTKKGQDLIKTIPSNKILTETDGPFIFSNRIPTNPAQIPLVVSGISKLLKIDKEEMRRIVMTNFCTILSNSNK
ncbi:MAG: hypothetical protein FP831_17675, partial [Anaerolineae bacterium]|nr:hypothetical protein [Anaerolineae bacterium]